MQSTTEFAQYGKGDVAVTPRKRAVFNEITAVITVRVPLSDVDKLRRVMADYECTLAEAARLCLSRGAEELQNDMIERLVRAERGERGGRVG
jgi:hypothetical protein